MRVLILQHIACEPPGVYEEVLHEHGAELMRVEVDEGEPLPDRRDLEAVVVMGGPMGAYDDREHGWLAAEKRFLRDVVSDGVPVFGVCLGAQLLALSLGGRAYAGPESEVGVLDVELTGAARDDPVWADLPPRFPTLQWHGDTFDLPPGAVRMASSPAYPNQAFRYGSATHAVQFHLEVTEAMAAEWAEVPAYASALESAAGPGALDRLLADFSARAEDMHHLARRLFDGWVRHAVRRR
jgi:GMP synthase (glutamine-hydrolysing)